MPTTDENLVSYDEGKNHKDEGESQYRHVWVLYAVIEDEREFENGHQAQD
jgi:hypothetical protein